MTGRRLPTHNGGMPSASSAAPATAAPAPAPGLRERKKLKTRRAIRHSAYRLFAEEGYAATSVDRIAEAAEVSPSTVFRYFPTKEDIVLGDGLGAEMRSALRARPAAEPPVTALRHAIEDVLAASYGRQPARTALRLRLTAREPALRARWTESVSETGRELAAVLAERAGRPPSDLEPQVCVGAMLGGLAQALFHWADHGDRAGGHDQPARTVRTEAEGCAPGSPCSEREAACAELLDVVARTLAALERGLTL